MAIRSYDSDSYLKLNINDFFLSFFSSAMVGVGVCQSPQGKIKHSCAVFNDTVQQL